MYGSWKEIHEINHITLGLTVLLCKFKLKSLQTYKYEGFPSSSRQ